MINWGTEPNFVVWELHRVPQLSENVSRDQCYCILAKLIISDLQSHEHDPGTLNFQQSAEHPIPLILAISKARTIESHRNWIELDRF